MGRPDPYIVVTKMFVISLEYLKSIWNTGPEYKSIYFYSDLHIVGEVPP